MYSIWLRVRNSTISVSVPEAIDVEDYVPCSKADAATASGTEAEKKSGSPDLVFDDVND